MTRLNFSPPSKLYGIVPLGTSRKSFSRFLNFVLRFVSQNPPIGSCDEITGSSIRNIGIAYSKLYVFLLYGSPLEFGFRTLTGFLLTARYTKYGPLISALKTT